LIRGVVALLLIVVVGALIGSGGNLEILLSGLAPPAARDARVAGSRPTSQLAASGGAELSRSDLKDASLAQLREAVRANPELLAGRSTGELVGMYEQYKQASR
jgi:hypothetical protein